MKGIGYITEAINTINVNLLTECERLRKFTYRKNMLEGNFYGQVELELGNVVTSASETGLIKQIDDTINLFQYVINETSKVYDIKPERFFDENVNDEMIELYEDLNIDRIFEEVNKKTNAFNTTLLQIGYENDNFNFRIRTPDETIVREDDFNNLTGVAIATTRGEEDIWQVWTKDETYQTLNADTNNLWEAKKENIEPNPLGFLPFLVIQNHYGAIFDKYTGDDLAKATIQITIKLTYLNQLIKLQSFKQLVATADNGGQIDLDNVVLDPSTVIYLFGEGAKLDTLDLESNYKILWDTIKEQINTILTKFKLSADSFWGGKTGNNTTSGYALTLQNYRLDKYVVKQQVYYAKVEKQLFKLLKRIDEKLGAKKIKGDEFSIVYPPITYPKSEKEIYESLMMKYNLGLDSAVKELMKRENLDEEGAIEKLKENIEQRDLCTVFKKQTLR